MTHTPDDRLDEYLWDPSAAPDASVVEVERRLASAFYDARRRPLSALPVQAATPAKPRVRFPSLLQLTATAAALVIVCGMLAMWKWSWPEGRAWPVISSRSADRLPVGRTLKTDVDETAIVQIARIGLMRISGDTSVTLRSTTSNRHRLVLEEGFVHVRVWAPPFSVGFRTPAGDVSDLGCEFELRVDGDTSHVRVVSGWVQLENLLGETLVPSGASGVMHRGVRPSVPVFDDAAPEFRDAVREHERAPGDDAPVSRMVELARTRDVFTLLRLVQRGSPAAVRLAERSAELFPPPPGVDPVRAATGDQDALDRWASSLPLPSPKRTWLWNWRDGF